VLSWIVSGTLSMDHGRLFSTGEPLAEQVALVAGGQSFGGDPRTIGEASGLGKDVREVEWLRAAGQAYVAFRSGPGRQTIVPARHGAAVTLFEPALFAAIADRLVPGATLVETRILHEYDTHYYGRAHAPRPLPVLRLRYDDPPATWIHIDLTTGTILERLDANRRGYRFWYAALHSHDLPWMLERMGLRLTWMTLLCLAGFGFSLNGVWVAWKRLRR
jgi:hypothetical protein